MGALDEDPLASRLLPMLADTELRAGSRTASARLTPIDPARMLVMMATAGSGDTSAARVRARMDDVKSAGMTTVANAAPRSMRASAAGSDWTIRAKRDVMAVLPVRLAVTSRPMSTGPVAEVAPRSSSTMATGSPRRWAAGSTMEPK